MFSDMPKIELKGETYVEKVLWTNSSSTSNFTAQEVTLSDSLNNYEYVRFYYNFSTSNFSWGDVTFPSGLSVPQTTQGFIFSYSENYETNATVTRLVRRNSDTVIHIDGCLKTTSGSGGTFNQYLIPTRIVGLKKINTNNIRFKTGTFYPSTSGEVSVDVGFKPKYLAVVGYKASEPTAFSYAYTYDEEVGTTKYMHTFADRNGALVNLGTTDAYYLKSIDNNGFTVNKFTSSNWNGLSYYFAIG